MPSLPPSRLRSLVFGTGVLLLLVSSFAIGATTQQVPEATDVFISDDHDPAIGTFPPFIQPDLATIVHSKEISATNASLARDFTYPTTQPSYEVGPHKQTLADYRLANLHALPHNRSTSVWFPDSNRSNGTVVKNAHVTILGTQNGTQTRLGRTNRSSRNLFLLPTNGTILAQLDYSTAIPHRTCTVTNGTKTCVNYAITNQSVTRSLRIGSQTWAQPNEPGTTNASRTFTYSNAQATGQTTMVARATIKTHLTQQITTSIRTNTGWQLTNTTSNTTLLSHTVRDSTPVVITTNQQLSATQTIVRNNGSINRIVLRFDGPTTLTKRRLWSYALFKSHRMRLQNVWAIYSQHRYTQATKGIERVSKPRTINTSAPSLGSLAGQSNRSWPATTSQETLPAPNVLEKQLIAVRSKLTIARTSPSSTSIPTIAQVQTVPLAPTAAPLKPTVNLSSVPPRAATRVVITNVDQPLTALYDIHGNRIPLKTQTTTEHPVSLTLTKRDTQHVRIKLTDTRTGTPISNQSVYLDGAVQGQVTTNSDGIAVATRDASAVGATFHGSANDSRGLYYAPSSDRIRFAPAPFNIYAALEQLSIGFVSVIAFVLFYLPFHYLRRR